MRERSAINKEINKCDLKKKKKKKERNNNFLP